MVRKGTETMTTTEEFRPAAPARVDGVRIVAVETVRTPIQSNALFVLLHGADGEVGLGETFYGASSVENYIHETAATALSSLDHHSATRVAEW
jgi:hypothetical protein